MDILQILQMILALSLEYWPLAIGLFALIQLSRAFNLIPSGTLAAVANLFLSWLANGGTDISTAHEMLGILVLSILSTLAYKLWVLIRDNLGVGRVTEPVVDFINQ